VIWVEQVLEHLVKKGTPSRGEMTDATMTSRAECVMLNKGPYLFNAITALETLLGRMADHQHKKTPQLRRQRSWADRNHSGRMVDAVRRPRSMSGRRFRWRRCGRSYAPDRRIHPKWSGKQVATDAFKALKWSMLASSSRSRRSPFEIWSFSNFWA
jgi:hypothetical protein